MPQHILVVDDETAIADLVEVYLHNEGFIVHKFDNAMDALCCVGSASLDLAILDVMLPDMDGFALCRRIREMGKLFPILMLTAKVGDMDKITGLTLGADDYILTAAVPLTGRFQGQQAQVIADNLKQGGQQLELLRCLALGHEHGQYRRHSHQIAALPLRPATAASHHAHPLWNSLCAEGEFGQ